MSQQRYDDQYESKPSINPKKLVAGIVILVFIVLGLLGSTKVVENLDNKEIMVVQSPFSGELTVHTTGGMKGQWFGTVTIYRKSFQAWFDGTNGGTPIPIKFNDGGHADIPGSVRVDLPLDKESIIKLHTKYGSQEAIETALVGQVLLKSVTMTGPTMTSKESYAERKNELLYFVEDQAQNGIYKTKPRDVKALDPLTGQERILTIVEIVTDTLGHPLRQEVSLIKEMNIKLFNLSFGAFAYDSVVQRQIAMQQEQTMKVQTGCLV